MPFVSKLCSAALVLATIGTLTLATGCGGSTPGAKSGDGASAEGDLTGKPAPEFSVSLKGGKKWSPADAQGKVLIIDFWATWCGPCRESFPALETIYKKHKAQGFELVAINIDETPDEVDAFLKSTGVHFPVGFDPGGEKVAGKKYPIPTMPTTYVIDKKGTIRHVHAGYHDGEDKEIEAEVTKLLGGGGGDEE
jgi:thiol-disulfide isomerase/thioredoxin